MVVWDWWGLGYGLGMDEWAAIEERRARHRRRRKVALRDVVMVWVGCGVLLATLHLTGWLERPSSLRPSEFEGDGAAYFAATMEWQIMYGLVHLPPVVLRFTAALRFVFHEKRIRRIDRISVARMTGLA